jgi:hypothetical protein
MRHPAQASSRGPYLCTKCAKHGKVAVWKKDGHGQTCPYKHLDAPVKGANGKHFNAKQYLASKGKATEPA